MPVIERIELYRLRVPLVQPWVTAYGSDRELFPLVTCLRCDGIEGWAEVNPLPAPTYCPEFSASAFIVARDFLGPRIIGQNIDSGQQLQQRLAHIKGHRFAKALLDMAWWDAHAQGLGMPLWRAIGGCSRVIAVGEDFGVMDRVESVLGAIGQAVARGAPRIKLKFRPGWDVPVVQAVRESFGDLVVHVDCNAAYSLDDVEVFRELDGLGLAMIEQPLAWDDLLDHAALQAQIRTPVCLDESITCPAKVRKAAAIGACRWINIKPARVGGLTPALEAFRMAREAGIGCWVGSMLETSLGSAFCAALASLPGMEYPPDLFPTEKFHRVGFSGPGLRFGERYTVELPDEPGVGCRPDRGRLRELAAEHAVLDA